MKRPLTPAEIIDHYMNHYRDFGLATGQDWPVSTIVRHLRYLVAMHDCRFETTLQRHLHEMMPIKIAV